MGNGHDVIIVEHSEKVVRVDTSAWRVGYEEGAICIIRRSECIHVKITVRLVVGPRGYEEELISTGRASLTMRQLLTLDHHDTTLDESNRNRSVAQHGG